MAASQGDGDLIAAIYDSIIEPAGWDAVIKRIVEATKSVSGNFFVHTRDTAHLSAVCNADPFYSETYVQHYHKIKSASRRCRDTGSGRGAVSHVHHAYRRVQSVGDVQRMDAAPEMGRCRRRWSSSHA
jgi:hypothetical protein